MSEQYDYIIVGAGSAGCILANRLTESGEHRVLLLEKGGSDKHIFIRMPTALSYPMSMPRFAWQFHTQAEPGLDGRSLHCPRGKVLGGSSSINGMVYVRGHADDFDQWAAQGAQGWSYQDCLPYFKKSETWEGGEDDYRGGAGPVKTCNGNQMRLNPLYQAFIDAGQQARYPRSNDYNGYQQEGFGPMHMTVKDGVRANTSSAHLRQALKRPNLTLISGVHCHRVLFDQDSATGIEYEHKGLTKQAHAAREVILCAGAIGTPQLLQLSGIGPRKVLEQSGVEVRHDLPGVGENLQDHLEIYFQIRCKKPVTLNSKLGLISKGLIGMRWLLFKSGLGSTNHFESCAFIRSRAGLKAPDIQYHFLPAAMRYDGKAAFEGHGYQVHVGPNKPTSRGWVRISSNRADTPPDIAFNYLSTDQDKTDWHACIRLTREILSQPALQSYDDGEIQPGPEIQSNDQINAWLRENVESAYHPSCSCKMGADDDPMAVLDSQCRVRGMQSLRVVDASIFPSITNGNLNAPTMMVAEKAADIILGKAPLPAADVPVWYPQNWQNTQR